MAEELHEAQMLVNGAIEILIEQRSSAINPDQARACSIAITELEGGLLWAAHAFSMKEPEHGQE